MAGRRGSGHDRARAGVARVVAHLRPRRCRIQRDAEAGDGQARLGEPFHVPRKRSAKAKTNAVAATKRRPDPNKISVNRRGIGVGRNRSERRAGARSTQMGSGRCPHGQAGSSSGYSPKTVTISTPYGSRSTVNPRGATSTLVGLGVRLATSNRSSPVMALDRPHDHAPDAQPSHRASGTRPVHRP